jgi:hypothetical protein
MEVENVEPFEPLPDVVFDLSCDVFWFLGVPWCWPF